MNSSKQEHDTMDMSNVYPSRFLRAPDLEDQEKTVHILDVVMEQIMAEFLPVIYFRGIEKGMRLNKQNNTFLCDLYGKESNNWKGRPIVLIPDTVVIQGQVHPTIRFGKPRGSQGPAVAAKPQPAPAGSNNEFYNDEIPL
jgi:hypothetical protein